MESNHRRAGLQPAALPAELRLLFDFGDPELRGDARFAQEIPHYVAGPIFRHPLALVDSDNGAPVLHYPLALLQLPTRRLPLPGVFEQLMRKIGGRKIMERTRTALVYELRSCSRNSSSSYIMTESSMLSRRGERSSPGDWSRRNAPVGTHLVGVDGFEPPAVAPQTRCATRLRHTPMLVEAVGIEPTTSCLQGRCSPQLSYAPMVPARRTRTLEPAAYRGGCSTH